MKQSFSYLTPVALGVMLSACSTTSNTTDNGSSLTEQMVVTPTESSSTSDQQKHQDQIDSLKEQLAANSEQIATLTQALDQKELQIAELMSQGTDATALSQIETLKAQRNKLEIDYNQLRLENDRLTARIQTLEQQNQGLLAEQSSQEADFIELNKSFRTLDSAHYALSKNYRDLSVEHAHLKSDYDALLASNGELEAQYDALNQENLKLGGALSEARAQHQVLWDKIRVQSNVINSLENSNAEMARGGTIEVADGEAEAPDTAALNAEITRLKAELNAQNGLISDYQNDVNALENELEEQEEGLDRQLEELESTYRTTKAANDTLTQDIEQLRLQISAQDAELQNLQAQLIESEAQKEQYRAEMTRIREGSAAQVAELQAQASQQTEQRAALEAQVNNLIPFEGAVQSLQRQLNSELTNVRWSLPSSANVQDTFEIQLAANVNNAVQGQSFYAELFTDSALGMMSASEAESTVENGQVSFRWRLTGLNEAPNATLNVVVNQSVNYDGHSFQRKVYRDHTQVELLSNDWMAKYGYWALAILGGLIIGFAVGKSGRQSNK